MKVFDAHFLKNSIYLFVIGVLLSGCYIKNIGKDSVLFVTKTSLGVDVDSKPPTFDVGFNRTEGALGPVSAGGMILPLMAGFDSEVGVVNQAIGQSFATGNASKIMSRHLDSKTRRPKGSAAVEKSDDEALLEEVAIMPEVSDLEDRRRYFFGTNTGFAFRVNFGMETGGFPDSLSLGYKRKEFAYVPLIDMKNPDGTRNGKVALPSLLATSGLKLSAPSFRGTKVVHNQFFATGSAAKYLAFNPEIRAAVAPEIAPEAIEAAKAGLKTVAGVAGAPASSTIAISPSTTSMLVGTRKAFTGSGGTLDYAYSVPTGSGTVSSAGLYTAGRNPGNATVRVTDSRGATADSTIKLVSLMLTAPMQTVVVGKTLALTPVGGTAPYTYAVPIGTGRATTPGATSTYTAGWNPGSETVRVTDNVGDTADLTVTLVSLMLRAPTQTVVVGTTLTLTAVGGTTPYTYSVLPIGKGAVTNTGGPTSTYTASPFPGSAVVRVTDGAGISADLPVTVTR